MIMTRVHLTCCGVHNLGAELHYLVNYCQYGRHMSKRSWEFQLDAFSMKVYWQYTSAPLPSRRSVVLVLRSRS